MEEAPRSARRGLPRFWGMVLMPDPMVEGASVAGVTTLGVASTESGSGPVTGSLLAFSIGGSPAATASGFPAWVFRGRPRRAFGAGGARGPASSTAADSLEFSPSFVSAGATAVANSELLPVLPSSSSSPGRRSSCTAGPAETIVARVVALAVVVVLLPRPPRLWTVSGATAGAGCSSCNPAETACSTVARW